MWDASTGAFIFGVAARHPNSPGLTAMSTNEGPVERGGGLNPDTPEGLSGRGGGGDNRDEGFGVGATRAAPAVRSSTPVAGDRGNLMLFTACEEGFVKTWRLGEYPINQILVFRGNTATWLCGAWFDAKKGGYTLPPAVRTVPSKLSCIPPRTSRPRVASCTRRYHRVRLPDGHASKTEAAAKISIWPRDERIGGKKHHEHRQWSV